MGLGKMNNKNFWSTFEITGKILPSKVVKNDQTGCGIQTFTAFTTNFTQISLKGGIFTTTTRPYQTLHRTREG